MSENDKNNKFAHLGVLGLMPCQPFSEKLIDRGFLYCIPCGAERKINERGDVEKCGKCEGEAYNLFEREF